MAVALEIGILDLLAEFLAHALGILGNFSSARAVPALFLQTVLDHFDDGFILVETNFHPRISLMISSSASLG